MSGARTLLLVLAASVASPSNGQFLRARVFQGSSSSFFSSSSWVSSRDGQMHQQVHEVRTETVHQDGEAVKQTKSDIHCKDGLCQQTMSIAKPGSVMVVSRKVEGPSSSQEGMWAKAGNVPAKVQAILGRLYFPRAITDARQERPGIAFLAPRPVVVQVAPRHASRPTGNDDVVVMVALAGAALSLLSLLVASLFAKCLRGEASAREPVLRALGEPLSRGAEVTPEHSRLAAKASKRKAAARAAAAAAATEEVAPEAVAARVARGYLSQVYDRAVAVTEASAMTNYLSRVYERAST